MGVPGERYGDGGTQVGRCIISKNNCEATTTRLSLKRTERLKANDMMAAKKKTISYLMHIQKRLYRYMKR